MATTPADQQVPYAELLSVDVQVEKNGFIDRLNQSAEEREASSGVPKATTNQYPLEAGGVYA